MRAIERLRRVAGRLKAEVHAPHLAYRELRVPFYARIFAAVVVGYAFSPIDLIPAPVLAECREKARAAVTEDRPVNRVAAVAVVAVWLALIALAIHLVAQIT